MNSNSSPGSEPNHRTAKLVTYISSVAVLLVGLFIGVNLEYFQEVFRALLPASKTHEQSGRAVVLAMNDIYRINGIKRGAEGGIPRIRTVRKELEAQGHDVLVVHAGDALSPSLLGNTYKGAQMVDVLNHLDGSQTFDHRLFITFGNHEFDDSKCEKPYELLARIQQSQFYWLAGNLNFGACDKPLGPGFTSAESATNIVEAKIVTLGGIKFGVFGVTLSESRYADLIDGRPAPAGKKETDAQKDKRERGNYVAAAKRLTQKLRQQGADYVIGVTHLAVPDDLAILNQLGDEGPDLILGGHDHEEMHHQSDNGRHVFKQTADAVDIGVHTFERIDGRIVHTPGRQELRNMSPEGDRGIQQKVNWWLGVHEAGFCSDKGLDMGCLKDPMGTAQIDWLLEETKNRKQETAIGNWFADQMVQAAPESLGDCGTDSETVAMLGSGSLRLNYDVSAGYKIERREVEELFPFPMKLVAICATGAVLQSSLENGLGDPGEGKWPHIAGMRVTYSRADGPGQPVENMQIMSLKTEMPIEAETTVIVVTNSYIGSRGDGYINWPVCSDIDISDRDKCEKHLLAGNDENAEPLKNGEETLDLKDWTLETFAAKSSGAVGPATPFANTECRLVNDKASEVPECQIAP